MVVLKVSAQTKGRKSYAATNICSNFGGKWDKKTALADLVPKQLLFGLWRSTEFNYYKVQEGFCSGPYMGAVNSNKM